MDFPKVLVFASLFCAGIGLDLPSDFQKCKRSGSNFNGCLIEAIQNALPKVEKGLPEFNLAPVQPLKVASMTIGEGKGAVHVVQKFKNVNIYDIIRARVDNVDAIIKETEIDITIDAFVPELRMEADYEFNGRVLVLPIVGNGPAFVTFKDVKVRLTVHGEEFKKKGQNYYKIKDLKVDLDPKRVTFNFVNLFGGDERLGAEMNRILNDNWKEIWDDVHVGYEETFGLILKNIANLIFKKVPHEQLIPL